MATNPCDGCGVCCMDAVRPPFKSFVGGDSRFNALPAELKAETHSWGDSPRWETLKRTTNGVAPCHWLNVSDGRCRHHEHRPDECRMFEPGCDKCNELRVAAGLERINARCD
jgi:Fe-S-cluster containining protein